MSQGPEAKFRAQVRKWLKTLPNTTIFAMQQISFCGDPDYILCCAGRFVGMELKKSGGKPSELQKFRLKQIDEAGGYAFVVSPDNWGYVQKQLFDLAKGLAEL